MFALTSISLVITCSVLIAVRKFRLDFSLLHRHQRLLFFIWIHCISSFNDASMIKVVKKDLIGVEIGKEGKIINTL